MMNNTLRYLKNVLVSFIIVFTVASCATVSENTKPRILQDFINNGSKSILPDFSYAGYEYGVVEIPNVEVKVFNVLDYGAIADDGIDDSEQIQNAVNAAIENKEGVVFFPSGVFHVNMDSTKLDIIKINGSHIVLRGSGSGENGTTIYSGSTTDQPEEISPWLSPFVFHTGLNLFGTDRFYSIDEESDFFYLSDDLLKGEKIIHINNTVGLKRGDVIIIGMNNTTDEGDLMEELMHPLTYDPFQTSYINAGKDRKTSFQWTGEIDSVINSTSISLMQPSRRNILTKFNARIAKMPMLEQIGIEHFRFECAYKGGYKHHLTREHDYGWGAICMHRVKHGWVRDIHINNYVQNTHLVNSRNVTIENVTMSGLDGHYGPKMYHSNDNLVQNIQVKAKYTHGPGLEGASFGNVYRDIAHDHPSPIDMHGISSPDFCPPMYNLYENISNLTKFAGGGAPENIPHSGEYNTFWGLELAGYEDSGFNELFFSWVWKNPKRFNNEFHIDCHKLYLRSILVGIHNPNKELSIEHQTTDRNDDWIYVESLNENLNLPSLYKTQLSLRLNK